MASAARMRPDVIARTFAGEITGLAIMRAVGRGREEITLFRLWRPGEGGVKETDFLVNIISVIGRNVKRNLQLFHPFLASAVLRLKLCPGWRGGCASQTLLGRWAS
jgi:hypothetical protein